MYGEQFEKCKVEREEYENCTFRQCDLAESNLSGAKFIDCVFLSCNLSLCKLDGATFQDVRFEDCKLLGLRFDTASAFGFSISAQNCQLQHASFFRAKLRKVKFDHCQLQGVDFGEADLTEATFGHCDLRDAIFDRSVLEKADFRTAYGFSIDPEKNKMKKARFSVQNLAGLLDKYGLQLT